MSARVVVAGIGNPYRRDDGVGPAVVDALQGRVPPGVDLADARGDAARLLDLWSGARLCVLVDAVVTGAPAGTVHRVELGESESDPAGGPPLPPSDRHSTHSLAIGEAVALGRALGRLPGRLVVLGVEAVDTGDGAGLSPPVAAAVPAVVEAILDEVGQREVSG